MQLDNESRQGILEALVEILPLMFELARRHESAPQATSDFTLRAVTQALQDVIEALKKCNAMERIQADLDLTTGPVSTGGSRETH